MDSANHTDCYPMVPDEIFVHIFRFLPLEDRKSIRLTCHHFYKLCDDFIIQSAEVIILRGTYNTVAALHCLSRSSRRIRNIELRRMCLNTEAVLPFFERQGLHVRSLNLKKCSFDRGAVKVMIEHCTHLRHFAVTFTSPGYETFLNDFEDLVNHSIVRDCVTDFTLILSPIADSVTNGKIVHFFAVFPRISVLDLDISVVEYGNYQSAFEKCSDKSSDISRDASFLSGCIFACLVAMADQLEVLNLYFDGGMPNIFNIRMKNLKQLSYSWFYDLPDIPSMYHSALFERLTHFSCSIHSGREPETTSSVIQRLLQFAPLQSLTIEECEVLDRKLFVALVKSKLRSLVIRKDTLPYHLLSRHDLESLEPSSAKNSLTPNYYLRHMDVEAGDDGRLAFIFAAYFPSVNHFLFFPRIYEDVLQCMLKDRTNVRSIDLGNSREYEGFNERSHFQDWLRKETTVNRELKYLTKLSIDEPNDDLSGFLLNEFVFPNLNTLYIDRYELDVQNSDPLFRLISKLPQLQSLILAFISEMSYAQWRMVCEKSAKLRRIDIRDHGHFFSFSEYVRLFEASPSLRKIEHSIDIGPSWSKYFFYDVMKNTVVQGDS